MTNKKGAAVLAHRDPKKARGIQAGRTLTTILPQLIRRVKRLAREVLGLLLGLLGLLWLCAPIEPAEVSWTAGIAMAATCWWLAGWCLHERRVDDYGNEQ